MLKRDIVVIGASAGGLDMLRNLVAQFPADFPGAIFIVWHLPPQSPSILGDILDRAGALPAKQAQDSEPIKPGHIYVARPDHHLLVEDGHVRVSHGPKENRFRPSVDALFRSAALDYRSRVVGVVLSGSLDDGASGLYAIKQCDGVAIVQDPVEAPYFDMPVNAMRAVPVDYVLPISEMGAQLVRLASGSPAQNHNGEHAKKENPMLSKMEIEVKIALGKNSMDSGWFSLGDASLFTCPECHGALLQIKEGNRTRFRCHTGHAFSLNSLLAEVTKSIEDSLWNTMRAVEESELVLTHMARHLAENGEVEAVAIFEEKARQARERANIIRQMAQQNEILSRDKIESQLDE